MLDDLSMEKNRLWRKLVPFRRENVQFLLCYSIFNSSLTPRERILLRKGRTIRKVMGREGNFRAARIFFRYQILCMNFI